MAVDNRALEGRARPDAIVAERRARKTSAPGEAVRRVRHVVFASLMHFAVAAQAASTDYTPAYIAAVVAVLVTAITAWTAQLRLRAQLRHDRELHDVGELRTVVDEAAGLTYVALDKISDAIVAAEEWAHAETKADAAALARHEAFVATWPMEGMAARLALRLTEQHLVYVSFQQFHHESKSAARQMPLTRPDIVDPDLWQTIPPSLRKARARFLGGLDETIGETRRGPGRLAVDVEDRTKGGVFAERDREMCEEVSPTVQSMSPVRKNGLKRYDGSPQLRRASLGKMDDLPRDGMIGRPSGKAGASCAPGAARCGHEIRTWIKPQTGCLRSRQQSAIGPAVDHANDRRRV